MKKILRTTFGHLFNKNWMMAAILVCATSVLTSCSDTTDNPVTENDPLPTATTTSRWP